MRIRKLAAELLVAVATSSALASLALSVPAHADPTDDQRALQTDQLFLEAVKDRGLKLSSDTFALDLAHSTCEVLIRTASVQNALLHIKNATDWTSSKDITNFGSLAVQAYCPSSMPKS